MEDTVVVATGTSGSIQLSPIGVMMDMNSRETVKSLASMTATRGPTSGMELLPPVSVSALQALHVYSTV